MYILRDDFSQELFSDALKSARLEPKPISVALAPEAFNVAGQFSKKDMFYAQEHLPLLNCVAKQVETKDVKVVAFMGDFSQALLLIRTGASYNLQLVKLTIPSEYTSRFSNC